ARVLWYNDTIVFEDEEAERVCVAAFDTDGDGALSYVEAESVTDLGDVFRGNDRIVSFNEFVYFTGVETLPGFLRGPFDYMSSLKEITLPPSLRDVGGWPFATCHSLENIFVDPANLRYYSVDGCLYSRPDRTLVRVPEVTSFDTFEIPSGITTIGYGCFEANSTIKELRIGRDVTSIAGEALKIYSLERVSVDPASTSFTVIDEALYALENGAPVALRLLPSRCGVTSLVLPSSVRTIGGYAICDIPDFHSITLNEGLESIQQYAFNSVSFDHLVIPSTVTFLNDCCLRFVALSSLTVLSELPPSLGSHVFPFEGEEVYSAYPVFVPAASMPLYLNAPGWSALSSRITPLP
ncbi:MAG: leucine-rich repeat protein, partial [Bacteroidales bacterium]|nr:leucine-rich repeat protein [Bacteroidales bacterium]MBP5235879.1 leucine-rich repeat protein [Bacteroidales bacterium]